MECNLLFASQESCAVYTVKHPVLACSHKCKTAKSAIVLIDMLKNKKFLVSQGSVLRRLMLQASIRA